MREATFENFIEELRAVDRVDVVVEVDISVSHSQGRTVLEIDDGLSPARLVGSTVSIQFEGERTNDNGKPLEWRAEAVWVEDEVLMPQNVDREVVDDDGVKVSRSSRRISPPSVLRARLESEHIGASRDVEIVDVSVGGIGLKIDGDCPLESGESVDIELTLSEQFHEEFGGQVAYVKDAKGGPEEATFLGIELEGLSPSEADRYYEMLESETGEQLLDPESSKRTDPEFFGVIERKGAARGVLQVSGAVDELDGEVVYRLDGPVGADTLAASTRSLRVDAELQSRQWRAELEWLEDNNFSVHKVGWTGEADTAGSQRKAGYRVDTPESARVVVRRVADGTPIAAKPVDLSRKGIGLVLEDGTLGAGEAIDVELDIPGRFSGVLAGRIVYRREAFHEDGIRIGVVFVSLSKSQADELYRTVRNLEDAEVLRTGVAISIGIVLFFILLLTVGKMVVPDSASTRGTSSDASALSDDETSVRPPSDEPDMDTSTDK